MNTHGWFRTILPSTILYYFCIVTGIALANHYLASDQLMWVMLTALPLSLINKELRFKRKLQLILIVAVFAIIGIVLSTFVAITPLICILFIFIFTLMVVSVRSRSLQFPLMLTALIFILNIMQPANLENLLMRVEMIALGAFIVVMAELFYWPNYIQKHLHHLMTNAINALSDLSQELFGCYLSENYTDHLYLYERRMHVAKLQFMKTWVAMKKTARDDQVEMVDQLLRVYEAMLACTMFRFQVIDPTLFLLCTDELARINDELNRLLADVTYLSAGHNPHINVESLNEAVSIFESHHERILQTTARDPEALFLFVASLKNLSHELARFMGDYHVRLH